MFCFLEFLNSKLAPVPEEDDMFRGGTLNSNYPELDLMTPMNQVTQQSAIKDDNSIQNLQFTAKTYSQPNDAASAYRGNINM